MATWIRAALIVVALIAVAGCEPDKGSAASNADAIRRADEQIRVLTKLIEQAQALKTSKVIEAEEFVLRDKSGVVRGRWAIHPPLVAGAAGYGGIELYDVKGAKRCLLYELPYSWGLQLYGDKNQHGIERGLARLTADGEFSKLSLSGDAGDIRLMARSVGGPSLNMGKWGGPSMDFEIDFGHASMTMRDKNRKVRSILGHAVLSLQNGATLDTGESSLVLFDDQGKVVFKAP